MSTKLFFAYGLQQNYYSPENILRFAEHLYKEGDYLRAAGEFQRYIFSFDLNPPDADKILYKIAVCYRLSGDFQISMDYFQKLITNYSHSKYIDASSSQISYAYFLMGKYKKSISFINDNLYMINSYTEKLRMQQLIGLNYIYQRNWDKAFTHLSKLKNKNINDSMSGTLVNYAKQGQRLPKKSKLVAGLMSAIIPGSGKIYCRRKSDGIISFLVISLTGWQAYQGFQENGTKSVKGWIYGTLCGFFYFGNIYGSVVAVNIYNNELENKLLNKVTATINVYFSY